jgi:hypothetical protein
MLHVCYLYKQTIGVIMKGNGKEKDEQKGFEPWSQLFTAKKHLTVGLHSSYG